MVLNLRIQIALIALAITSNVSCHVVNELQHIGGAVYPNALTFSVNWCGDCNYLATGGFDEVNKAGIVSIYQFNPVTETLSLTATTPFGREAFIVKWCPSYPSCKYLAVGGMVPELGFGGIIQTYSFDANRTQMLQPIGSTPVTQDNFVTSIDWCPSCSYLAAADENGNIQLYTFNTDTGLSTTFGLVPASVNPITSLKWCGNCKYLAAVDNVNTLYVYTFNETEGLLTATSWVGTTSYNSVDWCGECGHIAAGGYDNNTLLGVVDIYKFDPTSTQSISFVTSETIPSLVPAARVGVTPQVVSVAWCEGCDNLAVAALTYNAYNYDSYEGQFNIINLYHFDSLTGALSPAQTFTLNFNFASDIASPNQFYSSESIDWCGRCGYLAAGGITPNASATTGDNGTIELFRAAPVPPTVTAQKLYYRYPTQVDIVNQLCWDAVTDAVAYNVYAYGQLLATITNTPLCYYQHQLVTGALTTYYVTAVNAQGLQSLPAVVTI